jgi:hypothetical protein
MHPKPLTTPKRCGAGMAHTVASIGHVLSCYYCGRLRIIDYHGLSWIIVDYLELLLIIIDYRSWRMIMDYYELWPMTDYRGLMGLLMDYGLSWTSGSLWHIVEHCGFLDMHHHGIAWITVYARQASDDT